MESDAARPARNATSHAWMCKRAMTPAARMIPTQAMSSGRISANSTVACPGSLCSLLKGFGAGDEISNHEVEQLTNATRPTTVSRPGNDEQGDDSRGEEDERVFRRRLTILELLTANFSHRHTPFDRDSPPTMATSTGITPMQRNEGSAQPTSGTTSRTGVRWMAAVSRCSSRWVISWRIVFNEV